MKRCRIEIYSYMKCLTQYLCCFRFESEEHSEFGHYVLAINGVYASVADEQYWAFLKVKFLCNCFTRITVLLEYCTTF